MKVITIKSQIEDITAFSNVLIRDLDNTIRISESKNKPLLKDILKNCLTMSTKLQDLKRQIEELKREVNLLNTNLG